MIQGDFFFGGRQATVSPEGLREFLTQLPHAHLKILAWLFDRQLILCEGLEVHRDGTVRVAAVAAALSGNVLAAGMLEIKASAGQGEVFLVPEESPRASCDGPAGIQSRIFRARLALETDREHAWRLARVVWRDDGLGRPAASLDPFWWPAVARTRSHPASLEAAAVLADLLGGAPPSLTNVLRRAKAGGVGWSEVIPPLLRHGEERWRRDPRRMAELQAVAGMHEDADQVAAIVRMLLEERGSLLPNELPEDPRFRLVCPLAASHVARPLGGPPATAVFRFPGVTPGAGRLAIAIGGTAGANYWVTVRADGRPTEFPRRAGPPTLLPVSLPSKPFEVEIQGASDENPPVAIGVYEAAALQQSNA